MPVIARKQFVDALIRHRVISANDVNRIHSIDIHLDANSHVVDVEVHYWGDGNLLAALNEALPAVAAND